MITLEPPAARSDAEGCGAAFAELRAQADAMRDAGDEKGADALLFAIGDINLIEGNVIHSTGPGIRIVQSSDFRFDGNICRSIFDAARTALERAFSGKSVQAGSKRDQ